MPICAVAQQTAAAPVVTTPDIEVQIAEVSLSGDFQFGLQSYFQGKLGSSQNRLTSDNGFGSVLATGFSYTWKKTDAIQAILNLSEAKNKIRTISQPTLIVKFDAIVGNRCMPPRMLGPS